MLPIGGFGTDAADGGMVLRHDQLTAWRANHPAWRLLAADNAPMVISFLSRTFLEPNVRSLPRTDLLEALEEHLDGLRRAGDDYLRTADAYVDAWANPKTGRWLRRTHPAGEDEPRYEPTLHVETVAASCRELGDRRFVGTASRLLTIRDLLRQITVGSAADPADRIRALERQRADIDEQLRAIRSGQDTRLEPAAVRDMYGQVRATARDLLADLRAVEESFRELDRDVRAKAAMWDGPRGAFLEEVFGTTHAIDATDQGRSWEAFWEHLLNHRAKRELDQLLEAVEAMPAVAGHTGEAEQVLRHDLFTAADGTQRTVASVSAQLRRFLDDDSWAESRRVSRLLRGTLALAARTHHDWVAQGQDPEDLPGAELDATRVTVGLPGERPLHQVKTASKLTAPVEEDGEPELDTSGLAGITYINMAELRAAVIDAVQARGGLATLGDIVAGRPLTQGLAELVGYLQVAGEQDADTLTSHEAIRWQDGEVVREARVPRILFTDTELLAGRATGRQGAAVPDSTVDGAGAVITGAADGVVGTSTVEVRGDAGVE